MRRRSVQSCGHALPHRHLQCREPDESLRFLGLFATSCCRTARCRCSRSATKRTYRQLEMARAIAHADDTRQLSALAIAATRADIICLQEVDNLAALQAFEYGYLYKMVGSGYRHKFTTPRQMTDAASMSPSCCAKRRATAQPIEVEEMVSHAHVTFEEFGLFTPALAEMGVRSRLAQSSGATVSSSG